MKTTILIIAAASAAALFGGPAEAGPTLAPSHVYEFDGDTKDARGGPAMTAGTGASYTGAGTPQGGMRFTANQGPIVGGVLASPRIYTIEAFFSLDQVSNYRNLINFKNSVSDDGLYLNNGDLRFFGGSRTADTNLAANSMIHLTLSRDESERVRAYIGGQEVFNFLDDTYDLATFDGVYNPGNILSFFRDNRDEASAGFVDYVRLYDRALTGSEVAELYNNGNPLRDFDYPTPAVPEPATWALMILGFGMVGATMRQRVATAAVA